MDHVYRHPEYYVQLEQPIIDLEHLFPDSPHVLVQVKIWFMFVPSFIDYNLHGLRQFFAPVAGRRSTFVLRDLVDNSRSTYTILSETLSTLGIEQQYLNRIIGGIVSYGGTMYNHVGNRGRKVLALDVRIGKMCGVYVHPNGSLMDRALRESAAEFERTNFGMVPANQSALGRLLKRVKIEDVTENHPTKRRRTSESQQNCTICLEEFTNGQVAISMPCSHIFHGGCILKWLKQSHYCPLCRYEMPT